eukprot:m.148688 g.148688  ORF g.148688 m.148688 type:complete len:897 (+) comp15003_c0_seq2:3062-5752(+)
MLFLSRWLPVVIFGFVHYAMGDKPNTVLYDGATLVMVKEMVASGHFKEPMIALEKAANDHLSDPNYTVMDKRVASISGDKHDYYSLAIYWWPCTAECNKTLFHDCSHWKMEQTSDGCNKTSGLPWIRHDGYVNPATHGLDETNWGNFNGAYTTLAFYAFFANSDKHAKRANEMFAAWFSDSNTLMHPNLDYAQAIPGICDGRGIGIIGLSDHANFVRVLDAMQLLTFMNLKNAPGDDTFQQWLTTFFNWFVTSKNGKDEHAALNNHGTWYDVMYIGTALHINNITAAQDHCARVVDDRFAVQISENGSLPMEDSRTKSEEYHSMDTEGLLTLATLCNNVHFDLFHATTKKGLGLEKVLQWFYPYANQEKPWPFTQIETFDRTNLIEAFRIAALAYNSSESEAVVTSVQGWESNLINLLRPFSLPQTQSISMSNPKNIIVDLTAPAMLMNLTYGVDHGPFCDSGVNVAEELLSFGASVIRTHDSGVLDWPIVFPHPGLNVSTSDPNNYDFEAADQYFDGIVSNGLDPYFRLGTSWGQLGGGLPPAGVPYNMSALVDVLLHTVMHYNDGWGMSNSSNMTWKGKHTVKYFEIWNEPDSAVHDGRFWNRSSSDFYDLMDATIRAIKAYDNTLVVGTDGVAVATAPASAPYSWGLIAELAKRKTPFDFFSWHAYTDDLDLYRDMGKQVRAHLDDNNLQDVAMHCTEWFPCILCQEQDTAKGAAVVAGTLTLFTEMNVSLATLYPLCSFDEGNRTGGHGWGLFDDQSKPGTATWRKLTYSYQLFGEIAQTTPHKMDAVLNNGSDNETQYTVLAAKNEESSVVKLLISSSESQYNGVNIRIAVGDGGRDLWRYQVVIINATSTMQEIDSGVMSPVSDTNGESSLKLVFDLVAPAVAFVRLWRL